jgi:starch synthase (maltosyl-transferring)
MCLLESFGIDGGDPFQVEDLLTGEKFVWRGLRNFVMLDPHSPPGARVQASPAEFRKQNQEPGVME